MTLTGAKSNTSGRGREVLRFIRGLILRPCTVEFALVFAAFFGRFMIYGPQYFTRAGDYAELYNHAAYYSSYSGSLIKYLQSSGLLLTRPLAELGNAYVWSRFFGNLVPVLVILALIYAVSAVMIRRVLNRVFGTGYLFTLIFCLIPASCEGLYVLSEATAAVPAFFFTALSLLFIYKVKETQKLRFVPLFALVQLLTFAFDERIALVCCAASVAVALKKRSKYSLTALLTVSNVCLYALYLQIGSIILGSDASYTAILFSKGYFSGTFAPAAAGTARSFTAFLPVDVFKTGLRGMGLVFSENKIPFLIFAVLLCAAAAVAMFRQRGEEENGDARGRLITLVWSAVITAAPLIPLFFREGGSVTVSDVVPSLFGFALFCDTVMRMILRGRRAVTVPVIALLSFVCLIGSVSEMRDFKTVTEFDRSCADDVLEFCREAFGANEDPTEDERLAILNIRVTPRAELNVRGGQTVAAAVSDETLFNDLIRSFADGGQIPFTVPLPVDENGYFYYRDDGDSKRVEKFDYVAIATDYTMIRVFPSPGWTEVDYDPRATYENYILYSDEMGGRPAHVSEYKNHGIFKFY